MKPRKIESTRNPIVRDAYALKTKGKRLPRDKYLIEGPNLIDAALKTGRRCTLKEIFFSSRFKERDPVLYKKVLHSYAVLYEAAEPVIEKLTDTGSPQGIVAVVAIKRATLQSLLGRGVIVILDGIQDPGNVGTIIRTADAFGVEAVILTPGSADPFLPKAMRASAGSVLRLPVIEADTEEIIGALKYHKVPLGVTVLTEGDLLYQLKISAPVALAFGNESVGVSPELIQAAEARIQIPLTGKAESLNVASAAAICLYETARGDG